MSSFACLGFAPLRDSTCARPLFARHPKPRYAPSSGFLNLSTVYSALKLAGLFHPAATSRISPVQGLLPGHSHPSSSEGACPRVVGTSSLARLRKLHIRCPSTSRLYSAARCVRPSPLFTKTTLAPLFRFFSSRSLRFCRRSQLTQDLPLWTLSNEPFACALGSFHRLQCLLDKNFDRFVSKTTNLLEFSSLPSKNPVSQNLPMMRLSAFS
jgi:hypothetical protein